MAYTFKLRLAWGAVINFISPNNSYPLTQRIGGLSVVKLIQDYCTQITAGGCSGSLSNYNASGNIYLKLNGNQIFSANYSHGHFDSYNQGFTVNNPTNAITGLTAGSTGNFSGGHDSQGNCIIFTFSIPESQIQGKLIKPNFGTETPTLNFLSQIFRMTPTPSSNNTITPVRLDPLSPYIDGGWTSTPSSGIVISGTFPMNLLATHDWNIKP